MLMKFTLGGLQSSKQITKPQSYIKEIEWDRLVSIDIISGDGDVRESFTEPLIIASTVKHKDNPVINFWKRSLLLNTSRSPISNSLKHVTKGEIVRHMTILALLPLWQYLTLDLLY